MSSVDPPQAPPSKRKAGGTQEDISEKINHEEAQTALDEVCKIQGDMAVITDQYCRQVAHIEVKNHTARKDLFAKRREQLKKLPNFWQQTIANHESLTTLVTMVDFGILEYLTDFDMTVSATDDTLEDGREITIQTHKLMFHFKENPYFEDKVLWREMYHRIGVDDHKIDLEEDDDDEGGDGESAAKKRKLQPSLEMKIRESKASGIKWKKGNDLFTKGEMKLEGQPLPYGLADHESFFWFFNEKSRSDEDDDEGLLEYEDVENIATVLKEDIFEEPLQYYLDNDDEEDFEEGEGDDEGEDGEDEGEGDDADDGVEVD